MHLCGCDSSRRTTTQQFGNHYQKRQISSNIGGHQHLPVRARLADLDDHDQQWGPRYWRLVEGRYGGRAW